MKNDGVAEYKPDGGPAFPGNHIEIEDREAGPQRNISVPHEGMSLRDYFAAKVLVGIFSSADGAWRLENPNHSEKGIMPTAEIAFKYADAMLKEREK